MMISFDCKGTTQIDSNCTTILLGWNNSKAKRLIILSLVLLVARLSNGGSRQIQILNPNSLALIRSRVSPKLGGCSKRGKWLREFLSFTMSDIVLSGDSFGKQFLSSLSLTSFASTTRKVVHLDADLFSSTLLVLTSLAGRLKLGDVLIFDEFCVPNHEFFAFDVFTEMFDFKYELLGAANNYLQVALKII